MPLVPSVKSLFVWELREGSGAIERGLWLPLSAIQNLVWLLHSDRLVRQPPDTKNDGEEVSAQRRTSI